MFKMFIVSKFLMNAYYLLVGIPVRKRVSSLFNFKFIYDALLTEPPRPPESCFFRLEWETTPLGGNKNPRVSHILGDFTSAHRRTKGREGCCGCITTRPTAPVEPRFPSTALSGHCRHCGPLSWSIPFPILLLKFYFPLFSSFLGLTITYHDSADDKTKQKTKQNKDHLY